MGKDYITSTSVSLDQKVDKAEELIHLSVSIGIHHTR